LGSEYIALFLFDGDGNLIESKTDDFGPRETLDDEKCRRCYEQRLRELGDVKFGRIDVKPFAIKQFGTTFGLLPREPMDEDDVWAVELHPGNYMAFFEPWDSGDYDT
jgi:hypothetical protein